MLCIMNLVQRLSDNKAAAQMKPAQEHLLHTHFASLIRRQLLHSISGCKHNDMALHLLHRSANMPAVATLGKQTAG